MRIQHNIMAMNAYRNYSSNTSALSKNLEKLSSGYKINRAGDDAAGLAISEKMRAQITGLETAQKNAKDGISLVQTAEGALTEVHDMLNRMVELADQSANGTYDDTTDRDNLQKEFDALRSEIDRISKATNFNGIELLNGKQEAGRDMTVYSDVGIAEIVGHDLGNQTIVHSNAVSAAKTSFSVDLHDMTFEAATGDKFTLTIGSGTSATKLEFAATATGALTASAIANKLKTAYATGANIGGQAFTVTGSGTRLTFTQTNVPANASQVVSANQKVTLGVTSGGSATISTTSLATGAYLVGAMASGTGAGTATVGNIRTILGGATAGVVTAGSTTITASAIASLADSLHIVDATGAGTNVTLKKIASGANADKIGLYIGDKLVGMSTAAFNGVASSTSAQNISLTFKTLGSSSATIGAVNFTVGANQSLASTAISTTAANLGTLKYTSGDSAKVDGFTCGATAASALKALAAAKGATGSTISLKAVGTGTGTAAKFQLLAGTTVLAEANVTASGAITFKDGTAASAATVFAASIANGTQALVNGTTVDTGIRFTAATTPQNKGSYNVGTTVNTQGTEAKDGDLASTKFTLDANKIVDGGSIRIGDKTYTFALGSDSKVAAGSNVINLRDLSALASDATAGAKNAFLNEVGERLSRVADSNSVFTVGHQGNGEIKVVERVENAAATDGVKLDKKEKINAQLSYGGVQQTGSGLTLQIGDTSDPFNQITVGINSMDCKSLGIDDSQINISKQSDAQAAVATIKAAINSVSSTRGDLGALQNRLEHTINNLSVMTENIQDAEASIRDVDVAKEMMDYTKNNILVQSAQAMLAQANQVPQGVLQLLQ